MWTDGIILLGALICAILPVPLLVVVVVGGGNQVAADGKAEKTSGGLNKWNSSDIWKNLPKLPPKWGEQYDLNMDQRNCGVQEEFVPTIAMPEDMVGDLFAKLKPAMEPPVGILERGKGFLKDFFSKATQGIKEKLDEVTDKLKNAASEFQTKKTDAVKNVKEKLDKKTDEIEKQLKEASNKLGCEEPASKCVESAKESFEEYQASLQQSMDSCLNEMKDAIKGHESRIDAAKSEVNDIITELKNCSGGDSIVGGFKERLSAAFGTVKCSTTMLANRIKSQVESGLKKVSDAVKKAGSLEKETTDANKCIEKPPKDDQVQKKLTQLVGKLNQ